MDRLISVIIPTYNRARTIRDCLLSLEAQTYSNWEAIVVDDGSTDNTAEVVAGLGLDDHVRLIREAHNRGAQAARNSGIRAARGEWIAFLDSDDQFLPDSLRVRLELAIKEKVLVVHSDGYLVEADGSRRVYGIRPIAGEVYPKVLQREGPMFQGLLVKKDALKRIGYLDERIIAFQEWDTAIRLAKWFAFGFVREPTFNWDCRNSDSVSKDLRRGGKGYEQVFHKHYMAILRYGGPRVLARHYRIAATWYQAAGDLPAVRRCHLNGRICSAVDPRWALRKFGRLFNSNGNDKKC